MVSRTIASTRPSKSEPLISGLRQRSTAEFGRRGAGLINPLVGIGLANRRKQG
jgi:hypothetical protein